MLAHEEVRAQVSSSVADLHDDVGEGEGTERT
jgi:hypothetical protein